MNSDSSWPIVLLGEAYHTQLGKMLSAATRRGPNQLPYLANRNVQWGRLDLTSLGRMHFSASEAQSYDLRRGDVLICEGGEVGRTAIWNGELDDCKFQNAVHRLRPRTSQSWPAFLAHFMAFAVRIGALRALTGQTSIAHFTQDSLVRLPIPHPHLEEQRSIANVLTAADKAISRTEELISKLELAMHGLLHDLLTYGIDDNGELRKDAGKHGSSVNTAIGARPSSWEVTNLGAALTEIEAGKSPPCPDIPARSDEWGVLKVSAVRPNGFVAGENKVIPNAKDINKSYIVRNGDLLMTRANTPELIGLSCLVAEAPTNLLLSDKTLRLHPRENVTPEFLFFSMQLDSFRRSVQRCATGSSAGMKNISQAELREILVALPSVEEQNAIVAILRQQSQVIGAVKDDLAKLRLLKHGLADDLLTGKVRVTELLEASA